MADRLMNENDVKRALGIQDFRSIRKDQLIEFVSSIPNMEKEVAIKCIEQFPNFKDYSNHIIDHFFEFCNLSVKDDGKAPIEAYQLILDNLKTELDQSEDLSEERKHAIIETMIGLADRISAEEDKKRAFKQRILQTASFVVTAFAAIGGGILGVKITKGD